MFLPVEQPQAFEFVDLGSRPTITVPLTQSDDRSIDVALEVRLWPGHWHGVPMHEFKFLFTKYDNRNDDFEELWDRNDARDYVEPVCKSVMDIVCQAARLLVTAVQPAVIYRATYIPQPPVNALPKHNMITSVLQEMGYEERQTGTNQNGKTYWLMIKDGEE